jgi:hypothetical protein
MNTISVSTVNERLRRFFLGLAAVICAVTVVELLLIEHSQSLTQLIPFALSALGIASALVAMMRPSRRSIQVLRGIMTLVIAGSLFGIYEHLAGNWDFALELHPGSGMGKLLFETLSGANPLLAPGTLAIAAITALAATYYHPALLQHVASHDENKSVATPHAGDVEYPA